MATEMENIWSNVEKYIAKPLTTATSDIFKMDLNNPIGYLDVCGRSYIDLRGSTNEVLNTLKSSYNSKDKITEITYEKKSNKTQYHMTISAMNTNNKSIINSFITPLEVYGWRKGTDDIGEQCMFCYVFMYLKHYDRNGDQTFGLSGWISINRFAAKDLYFKRSNYTMLIQAPSLGEYTWNNAINSKTEAEQNRGNVSKEIAEAKANGTLSPSSKPAGDGGGDGDDTEPKDPFDTVNETTKWFAENISSPQYAEEEQYFNEMYGGYQTVWSTRSFRSIIGMPFHFLMSTDPRVGSSPLGKQYIEDIIYDMPLVCLRPGGPVMNSSIAGNGSSGGILKLVTTLMSYKAGFFNNWEASLKSFLGDDYDAENFDTGGSSGLSAGLKTVLLNLFVGKYARFYTFGSDMYKYTEYVNTLCHLFISFLGIGDLEYTPSTELYGSNSAGARRKYAYYNDTWETAESDGGDSVKFMNGPNRAIFGYYQPESQLNQTYSNSTRQSELASTMQQGSSIAKEFHFLMGSAGSNLTNLSNNIFENLSAMNGNGLISKLMGNAAEGISTVFTGNNMDLPEIWEESEGVTEHTLVFKLVSPYGDRESIFLYVLRPLARLLAMSLPRQFGPNSYTSPFLIQAFSKGQFNVQCGIVSSLSVKRCGNGGESHTVHYIPTELEVTMTIQDMYDKVTLSNEYMGSANSNSGIIAKLVSAINAVSPFGAARAARLLFNNIGLIDFCAAYCGYNLNAPEVDTMWTLAMNIWANRINDVVENPFTTGTSSWKSPKWSRTMNDAFYGAVQKYLGFISG